MAIILVGMADLKIAKSPDVITTLGLGSCVGVTLWDKNSHIGGLAHVMLPKSNGFDLQNRAKFADLAVVDLLNLMIKAGAVKSALVAKIAGGAHMFKGAGSNVLMVGDRNAQACTDVLRSLGIPIKASDTGGSHGRTIELYAETGNLKIKTVGAGEKFI